MNKNVLTSKIGAERIMDTLIDAFEGGSNYWYSIVEHSAEYNLIGDGATVYDTLNLILEGDAKAWIKINAPEYPGIKAELITSDKIELGLKGMLQNSPIHYTDLVAGNGDAETADVLLQYILFGRLVFG